MAKQTSLIKIKGKADGQSFYTSKNGGALMRSINKGMSERVKTAKEFVNTRLNNAEFGACGDFAGAMVKAVSSRWRFILNPIATGHLVKVLKSLVGQDTAGAWGFRVIPAGVHDAILAAYTAESKNEVPMDLVSAVKSNLVYDSVAHKVGANFGAIITPEMIAELQAIGADKLQIRYYGMQASGAVSSLEDGKYAPAVVKLEEYTILGTESPQVVDENLELLPAESTSTSLNLSNEETSVAGILVVYMPCRTVGTTTAILQQHCAAAWLPIQAGTIE